MEIFNVGIHELSAFKWRDVQRNITDGVSRTPLEKKNFRPENIDESEIFIRELIQNSLDARKMTSQRVEVSINYKEINQKDYRLYNHIISSKLQSWLYDSEDISKDYKRKYSAIIISDKGTTGLDSDDWEKYFHLSGQAHKSSKTSLTLGSANQGKVAIWGLSTIWTVLCRTKLRDNTVRVQGKCLMAKAKKLNALTIRECDAFFRKGSNNEDHIVSKNENLAIQDLFSLPNRSEFDTGSDFVLLEANKYNTEHLLKAIVNNWALPILEDRLIVNIDGIRLDKTTLMPTIDELDHHSQYVNKELIEFCLNSRQNQGEEVEGKKIYKLRKKLKADKYESSFDSSLFEGNPSAEEIMENIRERKLIEIRFCPQIKYKEDMPTTDYLYSVFIQKKPSSSRSHAREVNGNKKRSKGLMMRNYQILWEEHPKMMKIASQRDDLLVLTSTDNVRIDELLQLFEEPSHLNFNSKNIDFQAEGVKFLKTSSHSVLKLFRNSANKFLHFVLSADVADDSDYFSDLFPELSIDSLLESTKKDKTKSDQQKEETVQDPVDIDIKQARRAAINVIQNGGKIAIISTPEYEYEEGDMLSVDLAADVLEGNGDPFKEYSAFDFDLSNCNQLEEDGCSFSAKLNTIIIKPYSSDFRVIFDGLHPFWGYVTRYSLSNNILQDLENQSMEVDQ